MRILFALMGFLFLALPVQAEEEVSEGKSKDYVILKVNGEEIHYSEVEELWDELFPGEGKAPPLTQFGDEVRDNLVRGLVSERLMLAEAQRGELEKRRDVQEKLEAARRQVLVQEHLRVRNLNMDEAKLRARYDELVKKMGPQKEYRASHILVETEEEAQKLHDELVDGKEFAEIAKETSKDPGSATKGGDLGYFALNQMVPQFSEAVKEMDKGEISDPVKSPFGWHVIKLVDVREKTPPSFEETKAQIEAQLAQEANQEYIQSLLENAEVKYYDADGDKLTFPLEAPEIPKM